LPRGASAALEWRERTLGTDARLLAGFPEAMECSITCAGGHGGASGDRGTGALPRGARSDDELKVTASEF
jgi:hypothetical protein